jgi:hypothetical protein
LLVVAQAGQINTGAFDPVDTIADITHERRGWLHVDGAFGLWARACPAKAHLAPGIEKADSWTTDGHKWLQVPYDTGYAFIRNAEAHRQAMRIEASYLTASEQGVHDARNYVPELSRRARGFATWAIISALGRQGIANMIEPHCEHAQAMSRRLTEELGIYVLNDVELNQFVVGFGSPALCEAFDQATKAVISRVRTEGVCFVSGASWKGSWVMRISIICWPTTSTDIVRAEDAIVDAWRYVWDAAGSSRAVDCLVQAFQLTARRPPLAAAEGRVAPIAPNANWISLQLKGDYHGHSNRHRPDVSTVEQREINRPEATAEAEASEKLLRDNAPLLAAIAEPESTLKWFRKERERRLRAAAALLRKDWK